MLCEKCKKNNATFFFEEIINGRKSSLSLCPACAAELKKSGELKDTDELFNTFSPFDDSIFGGLFSSFGQKQLSSVKSCPSCGSTLNDFKKTGKAGCADCYTTFSAELEATIRSIHGSATHSGKVPTKEKEKNQKANELKELRNELKIAIEKEEFEKAASLRDKIREMEGN